MSDDETRTLNFEVYRESPEAVGEEIFAVLTNPGPDTPLGTLDAVQNAVDAADYEGVLAVGDAMEEAGHVVYRPGKENGEVVRVVTNL